VNPYVALAAAGPWIVTSHGSVLHDNGGYGMLGFGHNPSAVIDAMGDSWVIANVMTPSFSQARFAAALREELGHTRTEGCPFSSFICMNSGSESVTVALRIADIHAKTATGPGGHAEGRTVKLLAIQGAFHGRTDRPAQASHSTSKKYRKHLASFADRDNLVVVPSNDVAALEAAFAKADEDGVFFELMLMEPVMGEGNPGVAVTREFYNAARRLTKAHGTLLLVDSIQAGLRAHGTLSIVDYPDFTDAECPDLETWSKALNAAQYPLSVLGLGPRAADLYVRGVYGNTMTTNPRALEVGLATLKSVTPELRANIRERGAELVAGLKALATELPGVITGVEGTGLLLAAELDDAYPVTGWGGVEEGCRKRGLGVIHGGRNALRFTPHFAITSEEVQLVLDLVRAELVARAGSEEAAAK
jgi:acetylornithine/succinyldiaminopimelate/putrescine aminotransferase